MIATSQTVKTAIHWEAVLITAVPAVCALVAAVVSGVFSYLAARIGRVNKEHLIGIDRAVNGTQPYEGTLRENVQELVDRRGNDVH